MAVSHKVGDEDFLVGRAIEELMLTPPVAMQLLPLSGAGQPKARGKSPPNPRAEFSSAAAGQRVERPQRAGRVADSQKKPLCWDMIHCHD